MGGKINVGVMLRPQNFYNKFYAKMWYYWGGGGNISIGPKLELVTAYHIGFIWNYWKNVVDMASLLFW